MHGFPPHFGGGSSSTHECERESQAYPLGHLGHAPHARVPPHPSLTVPHWPAHEVDGKQADTSTVSGCDAVTPFALAVIAIWYAPGTVDSAGWKPTAFCPYAPGLGNTIWSPAGTPLAPNVTGPE